jgi:hypothetical protein
MVQKHSPVLMPPGRKTMMNSACDAAQLAGVRRPIGILLKEMLSI